MHMEHNNLQAEYVTGGSKLETVNEEKDFGVIISEDLKWTNIFVGRQKSLTYYIIAASAG